MEIKSYQSAIRNNAIKKYPLGKTGQSGLRKCLPSALFSLKIIEIVDDEASKDYISIG